MKNTLSYGFNTEATKEFIKLIDGKDLMDISTNMDYVRAVFCLMKYKYTDLNELDFISYIQGTTPNISPNYISLYFERISHTPLMKQTFSKHERDIWIRSIINGLNPESVMYCYNCAQKWGVDEYGGNLTRVNLNAIFNDVKSIKKYKVGKKAIAKYFRILYDYNNYMAMQVWEWLK